MTLAPFTTRPSQRAWASGVCGTRSYTRCCPSRPSLTTTCVRLTTWQAAWRLAADRPATTEVAIAKFWASEAAHRVVYAAQHLHGGIGVDVDYPLHRYYPWSKQIELTLGSGTRQLARLGADLAR